MKERKVPLRIALPSDEAAAENEDQTGPGIVLLDRNGRIAIQEEAVRTLYGIEIRMLAIRGACSVQAVTNSIETNKR